MSGPRKRPRGRKAKGPGAEALPPLPPRRAPRQPEQETAPQEAGQETGQDPGQGGDPIASLFAAPPEAAAPAAADPRIDAEDLFGEAEGTEFEFNLSGGRGFIMDFQQGRDVINLTALGLTPFDLLPSINGPDLVLSFDGGEVVLRGCAGMHLTQWDFRY
ncbi:hypothetical protein ACQ5SO_07385 [Rhodovulum sp. DZ06]|uniref:hypothetical protein n=1 Tax=Rhodovulum sp. DZ06 TaxID=3425126 RepID=UPI003D337D48